MGVFLSCTTAVSNVSKAAIENELGKVNSRIIQVRLVMEMGTVVLSDHERRVKKEVDPDPTLGSYCSALSIYPPAWKRLFPFTLVERMFLLATVFLIGLASAQKVTRVTYCGIDEHHLRMDCKYEPAADSPDVMCKFTQNDRIVDTTDPDEPKDSLYKARAKIRLIDGNICQLRLNNLWDGKQNFTCHIKQTEIATKMAVVDKRLLATCSAGLLRFTGALMGVAALPLLLQISGLL